MADTFTPVADSYIRDQEPDVNSGGDFSNVAGTLGTMLGNPFPLEVRRILMQFDLSNIPQNAVINSASLQVTVVHAPPGGNSYFDLKRLLKPWTEGGVTWRSTGAGNIWEQAGATGQSDSVSSPSASVFVTAPQPPALTAPFTFASSQQLIADVQAWVSNPGSNNGWLMVSESEAVAMSARRFGAREDPPDAPVLTVTYSIPTLSIVSQPQSQSAPANSSVTFEVGVAGIPPFSYQWFFNGNALTGATNSSLTLTNIGTNQAGPYFVTVSNSTGSTNSDIAFLTVEETQAGAPTVTIASPAPSSKFPAHANITLIADATNAVQVEFFMGTNSAGVAIGTNSPYTVTTNNVPAGNYSLRAIATDATGKTGTSAPVSFSVFDPPDVTLSAPGAPFRFPLGTNVAVSATVAGKGPKVQSVNFFATITNSDGNVETTNIGVATNAPYTISWSPLSAGDYALAGVVLDELGQTNQSPPVLVRIFIPELILPAITITNGPANFSVVSNSLVTFEGTARDNIGLDHIEFQVSGGPFLSRSGATGSNSVTTTWSAQVPLTPGRNLVRLRSVDLAGNKSPDVIRVITYSTTETLSVDIIGTGSIAPNLRDQSLELGKIYTVRAHPGPGQVFQGWTGVTPTNNPLLSFEMTSGLALTVTFIANPFPGVAGTYNGVFLEADTNLFRPENAGFFRLQLARNGTFSGKATMQEASYGFHGRFGPNQTAQVGIFRHTLPPVTFHLQVDSGGLITGTATTAPGGVALTANLVAAKNAFTPANPAPGTGHHTFMIQTASAEPETVATGDVSIAKSGTVQIRGLFGDQKFSATSAIIGDGNVPFFLSLNHGADVLAGWLSFGGDIINGTGEVYWVHSGDSGVMFLEQTWQ